MNPWWLLLIVPVSFITGFVVSAFMALGACADCRDAQAREMLQVRADEFNLGFEAGLRAECKPGGQVIGISCRRYQPTDEGEWDQPPELERWPFRPSGYDGKVKNIIFAGGGPSIEIKPIEVPFGSFYWEEDTKQWYQYIDGAWLLVLDFKEALKMTNTDLGLAPNHRPE